MKKILTLTCFILNSMIMFAQQPFVGRFYNEEYHIFLDINFNEKNIIVPNQEIFGELDGYIGSTLCNTVWAITSSAVTDKTAKIEVINNYGSEDFTATVKLLDDNTIVYEHKNGSSLKFPVNKKWQKIPSKLKFQKKAE